MEISMHPSWMHLLDDEFEQAYFKQLSSFVDSEYDALTVFSTQQVFPPRDLVFNAFNQFPVSDTKVVILGQDPYHGPMQAHGLSFSVPDGLKVPPSLRNIFKELNADVGKAIPSSGNLSNWAKQGVLLLNATLTVRESEAGSHQNKGWEQFTDAVINKISSHTAHVVFILWGNYAIKKQALIDQSKHLVLTSAHPSPLAAHRGFFGNKHFSKTNNYLVAEGRSPIHW